MRVLGILLLIAIWSGFSGPRCGATVYYSNGSVGNLQQIHDTQAVNGDTITLPAGILHWTTRLTISKAITLQGAGVGTTVIRDGVQSGPLIQVTLAANNLTRITGIEFQDGGRTNRASDILRVVGSNTDGSKFRFDHCKWYNLNGASVFDTVIGVIDHNTFVMDRTGLPINIYDSYWNGRTWGDGSWAAPTGFGSSQFLFIEDNTFTHSNPYQEAITDSYGGGRFVVRHNNIFNGLIANHGTESTGRARGGRAMEVYDNTFTGSNVNRFVGDVRSGGVLFHDNTISGYWGNSANFRLYNFRSFHPFDPWGGADGTNPWDVNSPNVFFTGTAATHNSGTTVRVSGANWATNYWAGYAIRRTSNICNSGSTSFSEILSNTSNTITYVNNALYPGESVTSFCAGDSLEIRKVVHALDQPGRALGSLVTGNPPARPAGWNDQVTEPCYSWNNTTANVQVNFGAGAGVTANVHYFNNTPMPGYTPYTYPHPLVTGLRAVIADMNGDGSPDFLIKRNGRGETAIWYLDNNALINGDAGPTFPITWRLKAAADFDGDGHTDYALVHPATNYTAIVYMSGPAITAAAWGPSLPRGWELVGVADFNGDSKPDYLLYTSTTRRTAIWYLNNNSFTGSAWGPTLPDGWDLVGIADFDRDGHTDYVLFNATTGETAIWYLSGPTFIAGAVGPTVPAGWRLVATADFDRDGNPDFLLYNASTHETDIWYLNNNVFVSSASGPTLLPAWGWTAPE